MEWEEEKPEVRCENDERRRTQAQSKGGRKGQ